MSRSRWFYLFVYLFIFNKNFLFPGLLPGNIVSTEQNKCCSVKDLDLGDRVVSSCSAYQLRNVYRNVSGIKLNRNLLDTAVLIILKSDIGMISSIMVGCNQKFCIQTNDVEQNITSISWVDAKDLKKGFWLTGYDNTNFMVKDIEYVKFKNSVDSYEISLNYNHTFYLVDSNGNRILTHNIFGVDDFIVIGVGVLIGAIVGGCITIYKCYKKRTMSKKTVAKGVLVGALIGGAATAVTYYGIYFGAKYLPIIMGKIETIVMKLPAIEKIISTARANPKYSYFIGLTIPAMASAAYSSMKEKIDDFVDETEERENEDIDFSEIDLEGNDNFGGQFEDTTNNIEVVTSEILIDGNGNPIRDRNGRVARIIIARQRDV